MPLLIAQNRAPSIEQLKNSTVSLELFDFVYSEFLCRSHIRLKKQKYSKNDYRLNQGMWITELSHDTSKEVRLSIGRRPRAIVAPCDGRN